MPTPIVKPAGLGMDSDAIREKMIQRIAQKNGIMDSSVIQGLKRVPRHCFLDAGFVSKAYEDVALPIGYGQTISTPSIVGLMTQLLLEKLPSTNAKVLEIGTGCGYQTAILASLRPRIKQIVSIERVEGLHLLAKQHLTDLQLLQGVILLFQDGMEGEKAYRPYHGILAAACGDTVPQAWIDQLAIGGRIVTPVSLPDGSQTLMVIDKNEKGIHQFNAQRVRFVPLKSGLMKT